MTAERDAHRHFGMLPSTVSQKTRMGGDRPSLPFVSIVRESQVFVESILRLEVRFEATKVGEA